MTPAMEAVIADHVWTLEELVQLANVGVVLELELQLPLISTTLLRFGCLAELAWA